MQVRSILYAAAFSGMIAVSGVFANNAQSAPSPSPKGALSLWEKAVESAKMDDIMALYDNDAIMISTFAQNPLTKREQIIDFYQKVVVNPDIDVEILESHPRVYDNMATDSGRYALSYTQEGERVVIPARFTFVYKLENGKWMIVEHHSSRMPVGESKGDEQPPVADIAE